MRKSRFFRRAFGALLVLLALLMLLVFVGTRPSFLKAVLVPKVAEAMDADISLESIEFTRFSRLRIQDLRVRARNGQSDLDLADMSVSYDLMKILRRDIHVEKLELVGLKLVRRMPESTTGIPSSDAPTSPPPGERRSGTDGPPPLFHIGEISIRESQFRLERAGDVFEVSGVEFRMQNLVPGLPAPWTVLGDVSVEMGEIHRLQVGVNWSGDVTMNEDLRLERILSEVLVRLHKAEGMFADAGELQLLRANVDYGDYTLRAASLMATGKDGAVLGWVLLGEPLQLSALDTRPTLRVEMEPSLLHLQSLRLGWPATETSENALELAGKIDFSKRDALRFDFTLEGENLDLDALQLWTLREPASGTAPAAVPGVAQSPAAEALEEPAPLRFPVESGRIQVKIGSVRLQDILAEEIRLDLSIGPAELRLAELNLNLEGAPVRLRGEVDFSVPGYRYAFGGQVHPLQVQSLVDRFAPRFSGLATGVFEVDTELAGQGITGPSLRRSLRGHAHAQMREGSLNWADLEGIENKGVRSLHRILVEVMRGVAPALGVSASDLLNPLKNIAKRARLFREDRLRQEMIELPPFVEVRGTLGEPEVEVRRTVLTGLVAAGIAESSLIRDDRTRKRLEILGGLLTGEGPRPTPTPTPAPRP